MRRIHVETPIYGTPKTHCPQFYPSFAHIKKSCFKWIGVTRSSLLPRVWTREWSQKLKSHTIEGPPKTRYKNVLMVWLGMLCLCQDVGGKFVFVTFTSPESNFAVNWSNRS